MIYLPHSNPQPVYKIYPPIVYRYLDAQFVNDFFKDGSIRLSSFSNFRKHEDEQRRDRGEGKAFFIHTNTEKGGQTITGWVVYGSNAYVLSATMRYDPELMKSFNTNSYFRINNTVEFGKAIANKITNCIEGSEGVCLYCVNRIIHSDLGHIDTNTMTEKEIKNLLLEKASVQTCFMKDCRFASQIEYRFIWLVKGEANDYIHIKVPEAIQHCQKPDEITDYIASHPESTT
jgi:hypothetical protein